MLLLPNHTYEVDSLFYARRKPCVRINDQKNAPPTIWDLPFDIRRQLSGRGGRQRAIAADNHLMLVLNRVPQPNSDQADTVYFWRNRDQKWHFSERGGGGFGALETVVQQYEDRIVELEEALAAAKDSRARFQVCLLYTSPSPRDGLLSRMPSSA